MNKELNNIYKRLFSHYGPQNWWPGEGLEIAIGAILTQNTSWKNVEKALQKLRDIDCLDINCLQKIKIEKLEKLIKQTGYYRVKAKRVKNFVYFLSKEPNPSRDKLLTVKGLGPETTDSILLYLFEQPFFVIDTYTFRIMKRIGLYSKQNYLELQRIFMENIPKSVKLYNEYHALLVRHAKEHCLKSNPSCSFCPLEDLCAYPKSSRPK